MILLLALLSLVLLKRVGRLRPLLAGVYSLLWGLFFFLALAVITSILSCYIYSLPNHRCPFCILKPEYHYIGYGIYVTLIGGAFFGVTTGLAAFLGRNPELAEAAGRYRRLALRLSLICLAVFTFLTSYDYLRYLITGGE